MPLLGYTSGMRAQCVSFLSDYGLEDGFVAACHGVLLRRAPGMPIIDITHLVPPGDVRRAAVVLAQTLPFLPPGVHLAVVDPGVGTTRRAIVIEAAAGVLVGPDNGVLSWSIDPLGGARAAYEIRRDALGVHVVSATFHGRDLFAPAAAELARGSAAAAIGSRIELDSIVRLPSPVCRETPDGLETEVLTVDRFGNLQLAADAAAAAGAGVTVGENVTLAAGASTVSVRHATTFGDVAPGEPVLFVDSAGLLALAVRDGRASDRFRLRPGDVVRMAPARDTPGF